MVDNLLKTKIFLMQLLLAQRPVYVEKNLL